MRRDHLILCQAHLAKLVGDKPQHPGHKSGEQEENTESGKSLTGDDCHSGTVNCPDAEQRQSDGQEKPLSEAEVQAAFGEIDEQVELAK